MNRRFTFEEIVAVLQRFDAGEKATNICRELGISSPTLYAWRYKYGRLQVPEAERLKALEAENSKLKNAVKELQLENEILKEVARRKW